MVSACAHLFSCYSAVVQEVCYCLDYGIIPVYQLTAVISFDHYLCSFDCFGILTGKLDLNWLLVEVVKDIGAGGRGFDSQLSQIDTAFPGPDLDDERL